MEGTPTQAEALRIALEARIRDLHTALPGRVDSYDASKQTADITPMVRRVMPGQEDGEDVMEELPQLRSVPVAFMEAGDFYLTMTPAAGDTGILIFQQWDPAGWRQSGEVSDPVDHRLHHPAHAVFIPGYKTVARALTGLPGSGMAFGKRGGLQVKVTAATMEVGGSSDAAALASKVSALADFVYSHAHMETGGTTSAPVAGAPPAGPFPRNAFTGVGSAKLKLGG